MRKDTIGNMKKKIKETKKKNKKKNTGIYILILAFVIITAATLITKYNVPIIEIEEAQPVEETPVEEPEEILEEETTEMIPPEPEAEENIIEIRRDAFYPKEKTIPKNTEIKWLKKDTRDYNLNCYLGGTRVIQSPDLKEGDSFTYIFLKEGQYTCITTPYGLRNIITVEAQPLLSPTGNVVINKGIKTKGSPLAAVALIAIMILFVYSKKKRL